ncbi:MAG: hypothetical protein KGQ88_00840, partial [Chloroflexi bacterium]|nr:hypothetical protein [Chloroflexota bacterium]
VIDERMGSDVKISVIATGFDPARPLKKIDQPIHKRDVQPRIVVEPRVVEAAAPVARAAERPFAGVSANGAGDRLDEKKYDPNDLEVPSFLRRR